MRPIRYSRQAESDLHSIADYTHHRWGKDQAIAYLNGLEACCQNLAASPEMGRSYEAIRPHLWRFEYKHHVIFYRKKNGEILISRILHEQMLPRRHRIE